MRSEHELIFENLGLVYVGGMPLLSAYYLNGGVIMVLVFGFLHGYLSGQVEYIFNKNLRCYFDYGGTWRTFLSIVFIIYQFRYHWYNPTTMYRGVEFAAVLLFVISVFASWKKIQLGRV